MNKKLEDNKTYNVNYEIKLTGYYSIKAFSEEDASLISEEFARRKIIFDVMKEVEVKQMNIEREDV